MRYHPDDKPPRWETTMMTNHHDDKSPQWETTMMTNHPNERPPWRQITPMRDHHDERSPWWQTTPINGLSSWWSHHGGLSSGWFVIMVISHHGDLVRDLHDERSPWWQTILMSDHHDEGPPCKRPLFASPLFRPFSYFQADKLFNLGAVLIQDQFCLHICLIHSYDVKNNKPLSVHQCTIKRDLVPICTPWALTKSA